MVPLLRYTALRVVALVVVGGLLYLAGLRGIVLVALAFILSGLVSLVLLRDARGRVSEDLAERVERRGPRTSLMSRISARIDAANRAEDAAVDAAEAAAGDHEGEASADADHDGTVPPRTDR